MKTCTDCKLIKEVVCFSKNRTKKDGLESQCKECRKKRKKKYRSNPVVQEKEREYREKYNVENRINERLRSQERRKSPEYREYMKNYVKNNQEMYRKSRREYWERNKGRESVRIHLYHARIRGLKAEWTVEELNEMVMYFGEKCAITGLKESTEIDHFIPLSSGCGGTFKGNLIILNASANQSKGGKNPFDWIKERSSEEKTAFRNVVKYLASANEMTVYEYEKYVHLCFESKNKILS